MKIRTRLTIQFVGIVGLILLISYFVTYFFSAKYRENHFYDGLRKKANTTGELLIKANGGSPSLLKIIDKNKKDLLTGENITVYNSKNEQLYTNNDSFSFDTTNNFLNRIRTEGEIKWHEGNHTVIGINYGDKQNGIVITAGAIDSFGNNLSR